MSKELTPLEAFYDLLSPIGLKEEGLKRYYLIETALKDYELIKQTKFIVVDKKISDDDLEKLKNQRMFVGSPEQCEIKTLLDNESQKKLKALEIIKNKQVNVSWLLQVFHEHDYMPIKEQVSIYNDKVRYCEKLTQKQYRLLKEVAL